MKGILVQIAWGVKVAWALAPEALRFAKDKLKEKLEK